jgi:hypothetical protein
MVSRFSSSASSRNGAVDQREGQGEGNELRLSSTYACAPSSDPCQSSHPAE